MNVTKIAKFVQDVSVVDPDTGEYIELCVYKDPDTGGMFAVDASYLDQVTDVIPNPFSCDASEVSWIELPEE